MDWAQLKNVLLSILCGVLLLIGLWLVVQRLSKILLMVAMAGIIAFAMHPLVKLLEPRVSRVGATLLTYVLLAIAGVAAGALMIQRLTVQVSSLAETLPATVNALQTQLGNSGARFGLTGSLDQQLQTLPSFLGTQQAASVLSTVGSAVFTIVVTLFISLYFVLDGDRILASIEQLVPARQRDGAVFVRQTLNHIVGAYIRGQLVMALVVSASTGIGMFLLGVQYALLIAVLAFVFQLIPMIGPFMTGAIAVLLASTQGVGLMLSVLAYYLVVQVLESNLLGPRITGRAVGLHPAASLLALITGAELFGFWGAVLAVPLTGLGYVIAVAGVHHYTGRPAIKLIEPKINRQPEAL